jgi:hypothetical protein
MVIVTPTSAGPAAGGPALSFPTDHQTLERDGLITAAAAAVVTAFQPLKRLHRGQPRTRDRAAAECARPVTGGPVQSLRSLGAPRRSSSDALPCSAGSRASRRRPPEPPHRDHVSDHVGKLGGHQMKPHRDRIRDTHNGGVAETAPRSAYQQDLDRRRDADVFGSSISRWRSAPDPAGRDPLQRRASPWSPRRPGR